MILAWSFGDTELVNQVPTILSLLIQAWTIEGVDTNGDDKVREPSINPYLFLVSKAFLTARAHVEYFSPPIKGCVTRTVLELSAWCKNRGSSIGESCEGKDGAFSLALALLSCSRSHCWQWRIFLEKRKNFLKENWEKVWTLDKIWEFALILYQRIGKYFLIFIRNQAVHLIYYTKKRKWTNYKEKLTN